MNHSNTPSPKTPSPKTPSRYDVDAPIDPVFADRPDPVDLAIAGELTEVVAAAGRLLLDRFDPQAHSARRSDLLTAMAANDRTVVDFLRPRLSALRPEAGWCEDEAAGGALPPGEWWVIDPAEGNINHVHGGRDWAVTVTLVRDNRPVLTVIELPARAERYRAVRGGGATRDDRPLRVSAKTELADALVGTGQAVPGEPAITLRRTTEAVGAMLGAALLTRMAVPATLELIRVATGELDVFWQFSDVRTGLLAGALVAAEAGAAVTDVRGANWSTSAPDLVAAAPGVHAAALRVLAAAVENADREAVNR
jgi:myo-inositol-1(or 4)-monophosphatase